MAKSSIYRRGGPSGAVSFNMTPMIDCTFQLIIFFILASQMVSQSLAKVDLHRPVESKAISSSEAEKTPKVIVNVVSVENPQKLSRGALAGEAKEYIVAGKKIEVGDDEHLLEVLRAHKAASVERGEKEFFVEIRGDKKVRYEVIWPIIQAAGMAGIKHMNITALMRRGG